MKVLGIISTATLFLLLGTAVPVLAQGDHQEEAKPQKQEQAKPERQQQAKPAKQEQQAKPAQREAQPKAAKQETQSRPAQHEQQAKPAKQQQAKPQQRQEQAKSTKQGDQQQAKNQQQRTQSNNQEQARATKQEDRQQANNRQPQRSAADEQRQRSQPELRLSARGEGRIPDDRFRSNFGRGHEFRIGSPRLVDGYSRFQYGGYWFGFVQPWPVDWYYTDDVYVDYINGQYYLCNPSYPGDQIAISVVL
ncbi:MAG: hypothetical protein WAN23_11305 [Candidatus Acidiferrales bacterium]